MTILPISLLASKKFMRFFQRTLIGKTIQSRYPGSQSRYDDRATVRGTCAL
jgi:hypothetical protein